ncbi:site-specific DNA-methyltransferase [Alphaproteobacteria bacterium]|nr:site-specific DNA-methyltransferase [Alphaproteobacteria bacterium]
MNSKTAKKKDTSKKITLNKVYNEDCLKTLKKIPDNFIDTVITSPPYNMNLRIRNGKYCSRQIVKEISTKYDDFADNLPIEDYFNLHCTIIDELLRTSNRIFYVIQIVTGSKRAIFKMIGKYSEKLKDIIVWDKKVGQPAIGEQVMNRRTELILVFENDYPISRQFRNAPFKRGTLNDIWEIGRERSKTEKHGAIFPEKLVQTIIENFTNENDIIYDPFLGTGTTAVIAKKLNRRFLGSEISKQFYKISQKRIKEAEDLFTVS